MGHEEVVLCSDPVTGLRGIIAIHDTSLGPLIVECQITAFISPDSGSNPQFNGKGHPEGWPCVQVLVVEGCLVAWSPVAWRTFFAWTSFVHNEVTAAKALAICCFDGS